MLSRLLILIILGFSFIGLMGQSGEASLRDYLVNYGYWTTPQGAFEVEVYTDYDRDQSAFKQLQMKVEVEYGITDNLMTSLYGVFKQTPGQAVMYDSSKIEIRYRLVEYDEWLVDPALYLEYVQPADASKNPKVEAKVLLSKDVGDWNFVTNLKFYERDLVVGNLCFSPYIICCLP